ncbi:DNA primase [Staphylococcus simulans ACS-120-V-Sch1]|uniref:DNA primase n=1 Tax=Staphylococcus TaxID=1279 RepID=UPI00029921D4|nr:MULTISPECIES: DNA primase [Staphylococcus]AMG96004.1 DNA primase [Staphylococcus simulans]ATF31780.1 DNA primase [Staphylococcus simulans]EKS24505.1 DNA primase [Staphylococcus simulans ACS-120-V-Sch1]OFP27404.1 DNA primase [Staphylococcus sp. HMSC057C08]UXV36411.1 DNA primase [Staphylococcus simulans]
MRIEQSVINEIKDKTDILDLVSEYVKLEKRGRNYIGLCPFHDEKTPSFTVSEDKQICHCFGCKKGGNVFQFTQEIEGISFVDAVKALGERVNIKVDVGQNNEQNQIASDDLMMIKMHELMQEYYHYVLMKTVEGEEPLKYLKSRGFTEELLKDRKIGFAPDNSHFCHDFLQKKGYDIELAYEAGLLSRNEENFSYYDRFRDRIMFPLHNAQGRTVGYSGRTYKNQEPKYLNSPETPIFQKRRLLYNVDKARRIIRQKNEIILLEGFMDVIKADNAGVKQVVASMGTQISQEHIAFIKKLTSNVTLLFDGDFAGQEATLKTGQHLLEQGLNVFVIQLPSKMDPDEYITKYGEDAFKKYVEHEKRAFVLYKVNLYKDEIENNDMAYEQYLKEITNDVSLMQSGILQKKVLQDVSELFKVSFDSLNNEVSRHNQHSFQQISAAVPEVNQKKYSKQEDAERKLLKHFMFNKDIFLEHSQRVEADDFTNQQFKRIFNILHDYYAENEYYNLSTALLYSDEEIDRETLIALDNLLLNNNPYEHEIDEYIQIIVSSRDEETSESLNQKLREATRIGDSELQKYYLQKIVALNQKRMY